MFSFGISKKIIEYFSVDSDIFVKMISNQLIISFFRLKALLKIIIVILLNSQSCIMSNQLPTKGNKKNILRKKVLKNLQTF